MREKNQITFSDVLSSWGRKWRYCCENLAYSDDIAQVLHGVVTQMDVPGLPWLVSLDPGWRGYAPGGLSVAHWLLSLAHFVVVRNSGLAQLAFKVQLQSELQVTLKKRSGRAF